MFSIPLQINVFLSSSFVGLILRWRRPPGGGGEVLRDDIIQLITTIFIDLLVAAAMVALKLLPRSWLLITFECLSVRLHRPLVGAFGMDLPANSNACGGVRCALPRARGP